VIVWLVRHPRCAVPEGVCYGRTDVELHADAAAEAAELVARLRAEAPAAVYTSPLQRCRSLAQRIGAAVEDERLRELDFGRWEMQPWSTIDRGEIEAWRGDLERWKAHGGESIGELGARVAGFFADLRAVGTPSACVVTHAGVIRVAVCLLEGRPLAQALEVRVPLGSVRRIEWPAG
jgi:alpha-ribazole phosphatase